MPEHWPPSPQPAWVDPRQSIAAPVLGPQAFDGGCFLAAGTVFRGLRGLPLSVERAAVLVLLAAPADPRTRRGWKWLAVGTGAEGTGVRLSGGAADVVTLLPPLVGVSVNDAERACCRWERWAAY